MTLDQFLAMEDAPTAAEFGAKVGISEASISRIRKGEQNITRDVMRRIIEASGGQVTADGLLGLLPPVHANEPGPEWPISSANNGAEIISGGEAGHGAPFAAPSSPTSSATSGHPQSRPDSQASLAAGEDVAA